MNWNKSFQRKVIYIGLIAVLLIPLSLISRPSTPTGPDNAGDPGGLLARKRNDYNLSQAQLGEVDPASETMKLALVGLRPVAVWILWDKSNKYKLKQDWGKLMATLEQITKLQPNTISIWQFQAWNVSYNVSVEFDNYLHRYFWVKRGIRFLIDGTKYNRDEPRLLWDIGWFFGQKIGRSDEYRQFRREFRDDEEFHDFIRQYVPTVDECIGPYGGPDNWLVSREWFLKAQETVMSGRATLRGRAVESIGEEKLSEKNKGKSPVLFHSNPPMALINYSAAIQEEGFFDEVAQTSWAKAHQAWMDYGDLDIRTTQEFYIRLNEAEEFDIEVAELNRQLMELLPNAKDLVYQKKLSELPEDVRRTIQTPDAERTPDQWSLYFENAYKVEVSPSEIVLHAPESIKPQARWLAKQINQKAGRADFIKRYRQIVNFDYWMTRCRVEQLEEANQARKYLYQAEDHFKNARLEFAEQDYEIAWDAWAKIYQQYPQLRDVVGAEDVVDAIKRYASLLGQLDRPFPTDFKLKELVKHHDSQFRPWDDLSIDGNASEQPSTAPTEANEPETAPDEASDDKVDKKSQPVPPKPTENKSTDELKTTPTEPSEGEARDAPQAAPTEGNQENHR